MTEESLHNESSSVGPFEVSDELRPRIDELGLWDVVEQMRDEGYAVIRMRELKRLARSHPLSGEINTT